MDYFKTLSALFRKIRVTGANTKPLSLETAFAQTVKEVRALDKRRGQVFVIGNGGSAAIASHLATDLLKNGGLRALTFNETSLITCLSNDLGYEFVFARPLEICLKKTDLLVAISSSGKSKNILAAVLTAKKRKSFVVTLSGFDSKNSLRSMGNINFYVPSFSYGFVEIAHSAICHCLADIVTSSHVQ